MAGPKGDLPDRQSPILANLKTALDQCKMTKGQSLGAYVRSHEHLVNQLAAVGRPLSDILSGLNADDVLTTSY